MRHTLLVVLVLNLAVAVAKLVVGWSAKSLSIVADGFHSLTDASANVIGLVGVSLAQRPPDEDHPYGHRKFETMAALGIGALLALTAWEILEGCLERLRDGDRPTVNVLSVVVVVMTLVVNLAVSLYEHRRGEALRSALLQADAMHTKSDVLVSAAVLTSLAMSHWGFPQADLLTALVITAVIARAAFRIVSENAAPLLDTAVLPAESIQEAALTIDGVVSVHKVRTRGHPENLQADLHVQVDASLRIGEAHAIGHRVADHLRRQLDIADVVVHVEPALNPPSQP